MNLIPNLDRLICKRIEIGSKSKAGIILAQVDLEEEKDTCYAKILAVGDGRVVNGAPVGSTFKVGDVVMYNPRQPFKFRWDGEELDLIKEHDIFMKVEDAEELDAAIVKSFADRKDLIQTGPQILK